MSHTIGFKVKVTTDGVVTYEATDGGLHFLFATRLEAYRTAHKVRRWWADWQDGKTRRATVVRVVTKHSPCGIACPSMTDPKSIAYRAFQKP
jgi:hypothetical protein